MESHAALDGTVHEHAGGSAESSDTLHAKLADFKNPDATGDAGGAHAPSVVPVTDSDLTKVMQRRRQECVEFESTPDVREPAAASTAQSKMVPTVASSQEADDLAEKMRRRRMVCTEFESAPDHSTADVVAASTALPAVASSAEASDLEEKLRRRRMVCAEFESQPDDSTADAVALDVSAVAPASITAAESDGAVDSVVGRKARTDAELHKWLEQMRGRCQVLESTPEFTSVFSSDEQAEETTPVNNATVFENSPLITTADAKCSDVARSPRSDSHRFGNVPADSGKMTSTTTPLRLDCQTQLADCRARLYKEHWIPHNLRVQIWESQLQVSPGSETAEPTIRDGVLAGAEQALLHLIAETGNASDTHESATASTAASTPRLAKAFIEQHMSWLDGCPQMLFAFLAQLFKYHCPSLGGSPEAMENAFDGAAGLVQFLLEPCATPEFNVYLLLVDLVVLEAREGLLLLLILVLAMEAKQEGSTFGQVKSRGLGVRGTAGVCRCIEHALRLHEETPESLKCILSQNFCQTDISPTSLLPVCTITPKEILHHIYDGPSGTWRLVIVDVRSEQHVGELPLCLRLHNPQTRRAVLKDFPYDRSIHLCLMGDESPALGEEALELCKFLASSAGGRRAHLSVADGGWSAVAELVRSRGLELMRIDTDEPAQIETADESHGKSIKKAVAAVAGVADKVALGAAASVSGNAKKVFKGASQAFQGFGGKLGGYMQDKSAAKTSGGDSGGHEDIMSSF